MPKKFQGENTKAAEARARKSAKQEEETERKKQAEEDEFWKDDDKHVVKKMQRKEDKAKKQQEAANRRQLNKNLLEQETQQILSNKNQNQLQQQKVTRAEIQAMEERHLQERQKQEEKIKLEAKRITVGEDLLTENVNKLMIEGEQARTVDEAIKVLRDEQDNVDRNPEKRLKSAYAAYEEKHLPLLKAENPNLRLSQLKQLLKKDWQKAPENPMNAGL